jgi:hypothetical protein
LQIFDPRSIAKFTGLRDVYICGLLPRCRQEAELLSTRNEQYEQSLLISFALLFVRSLPHIDYICLSGGRGKDGDTYHAWVRRNSNEKHEIVREIELAIVDRWLFRQRRIVKLGPAHAPADDSRSSRFLRKLLPFTQKKCPLLKRELDYLG